MATNEFLPFAADTGANVMEQGAYETFAQRGVGQSGKALSMLNNKALRQASIMAAALGQLIADYGLDALDDGDLSALVYKLKNALQQAEGVVKFDENDDVDLAGHGNIILGSGSELRGTSGDGQARAIGAIRTHDGLDQTELGNTNDHTKINSLDRPTVELPGGVQKLVAYIDDAPGVPGGSSNNTRQLDLYIPAGEAATGAEVNLLEDIAQDCCFWRLEKTTARITMHLSALNPSGGASLLFNLTVNGTPMQAWQEYAERAAVTGWLHYPESLSWSEALNPGDRVEVVLKTAAADFTWDAMRFSLVAEIADEA